MSEFGHHVHRKDFRFCIICLRFNNNLKRAAPVVRIKNLSWTLSRKLCINLISQFTINLYLCCITPWTSASKINEWMNQLRAPSSGKMREFIWHATLTVHYGDSLAVECTSVVHLFLRCIVGLNECTREHPLWFRTPLKMMVKIGGDFGYSLCWQYISALNDCVCVICMWCIVRAIVCSLCVCITVQQRFTLEWRLTDL